jgi:predicted nucleotidyltransferase
MEYQSSFRGLTITHSRNYKKIYNISFLIESGIIEHIWNRIMPKSIILFGSYSRGEDDETSDIDIFVEAKQEKIDTSKFEKKLCRKIQLHFNPDFKSYSSELKNNIINGTILYGFLEGFK